MSAVEVDWRADPQMPEFGYGSPAGGNVWLHFFEQLPFDRPPGRRVESDGYADYNMTGIDAYAMYKSGDHWREIYNELLERYITVRPAIMKRAETLYSQEMRGHYCIGVHLRHAAHAVECPDPIPGIETWIERVHALLPAPRTRLGRLKQRLMGETSWRVCLASDVESAVTAFRSEFGDRLVVQPGVVHVATHTDAEVHMVTQSEIALGEQVLIDCLLLAGCNALLRVASNVATAVGYINPDLRMGIFGWCITSWPSKRLRTWHALDRAPR